MHINPSSSVSGHHQRSDQARPAESPNNARPEASTTSSTCTGCFQNSFENLKRFLLKSKKCAPSDSHEAAPSEDIAAPSGSNKKPKRATSFERFSELPPEVQSLIADKAAVALVSRRPEESAQKLARLATGVGKVFRKSVQDIQERYPDIKRAGVRRRQKSVERRINMIIGSASSFTKFASDLPTGNHVHMEEEIKKLLTGEPHVGVYLHADSEKQRMLLGILSEKEDMESLHLDVIVKFGYFRSQYMSEELKKINANNPNLHDVTLDIQGMGDGVDFDTEEAQALADALKENHSLQSLNLSGVRLDADGMQALADALKENHSLQSLNLSGVRLDADGMQALADAMKENHSLQSLNLSGVPLDADGMQALADALKENYSLQSLDLMRVPLDAAGMRALADALKENSGLQSLDFRDTKLSDDAVQALADALKENSGLQSLDLSRTELTGDAVQALAEALKKNKTLKSLDLSHNPRACLQERRGLFHGAQALADALKVNHSLKSLNLNSTYLMDEGAQALAEALKVNHSLKSLKLTNTYLMDGGAQALAEALQKNETLEVLNLSGSQLTSVGGQALISALEENETLHSLVLTGAFYYPGDD
jgi:Ran GTPase-activating protein (RanGAP) involved in mRNA processing and transport